MAREALVEGRVPIGFGGAVLQDAGLRGKEEVGRVEEGFGALGEKGRRGLRVGEWRWKGVLGRYRGVH